MLQDHSAAKIIATWLQQSGLSAQTTAESFYAYVGYIPEQFHNTPAVNRNVIGIFDSGDDSNDGRHLSSGKYFLRYLVQVRVRALEYLDAYSTITKIDNALATLQSEPVIVDSTTYTIKSVSRTSGILPMGIDPGQQTFNFSLNLKVLIANSV